ncbi:MAG: PepSY domain-containing protein [Planctomycetota bacterium]|nr:MAG: PepSY domain-containing protein [Planctomycetota bacterium]
MSLAHWNRKFHRWGAVLIAVPLLVVICSGILLQLKKELTWVQPPTQKGVGKTPILSFEQILDAAKSAEQAGLQSWQDVDRLDVRPSKGVVKIRGKNHWEVQVDSETGEVLQVAYRRSDLIEAIHDGSWFYEPAKLWVFLPSALVLFVLWGTGAYLWWLPHGVRRRKRRKLAAKANEERRT